MKKIVLLFVFALFLTGCSATCNIEIYNDKVREDMEYTETSLENLEKRYNSKFTYRGLIEDSFSYPYTAFYNAPANENDYVKIDGVEYYKNERIDEDGKFGQKLSYHKFKLSNYKDSLIAKKCYKYFNVLDQDDTYVISTSINNTCFEEYPLLDSITVNIKTNHKVVSNNADIVNGYHYTWIIDKENKDDAAIMLTIKKNKYVFNYENEFVKKVLTIGGIVGIIGIVGGCIVLHFRNKIRKVDEI